MVNRARLKLESTGEETGHGFPHVNPCATNRQSWRESREGECHARLSQPRCIRLRVSPAVRCAECWAGSDWNSTCDDALYLVMGRRFRGEPFALCSLAQQLR